MGRVFYALSLRQPWAALLVHGLKTIEVRRWATERRGLILVHASRSVDERREVWNALPEAAVGAAELRGGIIGAAELVDCVAYHSRAAFKSDRKKHWNRPEWFCEPVLYGFVLRNPRLLPFRRCPGWFKFFSVRLSDYESPKAALGRTGRRAFANLLQGSPANRLHCESLSEPQLFSRRVFP